MSDLKAVYTDDRYFFTTLDGNATIELDRIRVDRSGELRAEVEIRWHVRPHDGLLKHGNLNLLADRSIKSWASELEERAEYDWYAVLTAVTKLAKDRYRQGDPPVVLADINPADRPPWFVDPFIQHGGPTVIAAPGGSGKSLFALAFAVSVASGHSRILNLALPEPRPVLYLDWEADGYQQHDRLAAICRGHKIDKPRGLHYRREYAPITQSAPELVRAIAKLQVGFVVVDSKGAALGGAPEEAEPTLALFRAVRSLNVPCQMHRPWSRSHTCALNSASIFFLLLHQQGV